MSNDCAPEPAVSPLRLWLAERGLEKYVPNFKRVDADLALLSYLTEEDLQQIGVTTLGARKKIKLGADELKQEILRGDQNTEYKENVSSGAFPAAPLGSILRFLHSPSLALNQPLPPQTTPFSKPMSKLNGSSVKNGKGSNQWAHQASKGRGRSWGPKSATIIPFRPWQQVPGTSFIVDRFSNLPPKTPERKHWFLTHFHADHYKGLTSKWALCICIVTTVCISPLINYSLLSSPSDRTADSIED